MAEKNEGLKIGELNLGREDALILSPRSQVAHRVIERRRCGEEGAFFRRVVHRLIERCGYGQKRAFFRLDATLTSTENNQKGRAVKVVAMGAEVTLPASARVDRGFFRE